jgi:UDP-3-O-[3-hydroxymyristoyl] glucosamine N-acyltransferase
MSTTFGQSVTSDGDYSITRIAGMMGNHKRFYSMSKTVYNLMMGFYSWFLGIYVEHSSPRGRLPRNMISQSAILDITAHIAERGVVVGERSFVGPRAVILENSVIENDVIIGPGAIIGGKGFNCYRLPLLTIPGLSLGWVRISNGARIGCKACVDKGTRRGAETRIGKNCIVGDGVHVGHDVFLGEESVIEPGAMIAGHVVVGKQAFIGKNATISNSLKIGDTARVAAGSVVTKEVAPGSILSGNFAIDMKKHMGQYESVAKGESIERGNQT